MKLFAVFFVFFALLFAFGKDATLVLEPCTTREIEINGKKIVFDGMAVDFNGEEAMAFGEKVYSFPAKGLVGKKGTMVLQFALDKEMKKSKSAARTLAVIRARGREEIGFYTFSKGYVVQYRFANGRNNFYGSSQKIQGGKIYTAVFSWDGDKMRCYLDGKLIKEAPQEFQVPEDRLNTINIGPHQDPYYITPAWPNDTYIKSLRLYNRTLSNEEIASFSGLGAVPVHKRYPRTITVPRRSEDACGMSYVSVMPTRSSEKVWELPKNHGSFSYDDKNLYVDFDTIFPAKTNILKGHSAADPEAGVWGVESFELHLRHSGKRYYFGGSVNGGKTDMLKDGGDYNPEWKYDSHIGMQIDDTFLWTGKIALPWKAIGFDAPPAELKMNFCRSFFNSHVTAATDLANQLSKGYWADDEYFVTLKFDKNAPSMRVISLGNPSFGSLEQTFEFISPTDRKLKFYIIQESSAGLLTPQNLCAMTLDMKANVPQQKKILAPLTMLQADRLVYKLVSEDEKQVFLCQDMPLKISAEYLSVTPYYYREKLAAAIKTGILKSKFGAAEKFTLSMRDPGGKVIFSTGDIKDNVEIDFSKDSAPGSYTVEITDSKGEVVSGQSLFFPGYGPWNSMEFDMTRIIPPYKPMTYGKNGAFEAGVVGRDYIWSKGSIISDKITSKGDTVVTGADFVVNGNVLKGALTVSSTMKHRADFRAEASNNDCKVVSDGWLEFDGVQHNQVEFTALNRISSIELRFRIPAKFAKYMHTSANGWGNKITAKIENGRFDYKFYAVNFIGNEEKGICFFAESDRSWTPQPKPLSIEKNDREAVFTVSIAKNLKPGDKVRFDYGLLGTPVKPQHKRYPLNTASWGWSTQMNRPGRTPTAWCAYLNNVGTLADMFADVPGVDNEPILKKNIEEIQLYKKHNVKPFKYNPFYTSDEYPEVQAFGNEWETVPRQVWTGKRKDKTHTLFLLCPASKGADFFLWRTKNFIEKTKVSGINFDFGIVPVCDNVHHGCHGRTPLIAYRNFYRKLAMILIDSGTGDDYIIHVHNTSSVQLPSYTFATHLLNGEHIRQQSSTLMHDGKDILDTYKLPMFACELNSLPFGLYNADYQSQDFLLKQYGGTDEDPELYKLRITRAFLSGSLIHNTITGLNRSHFGIFDKLVRIYDKFNVPESEFVGYWDERKAAEVVSGEEVYASLYKHPTDNRILAVISHIGNKRIDQNVTVRFNPAALKMKGFKTATELMEADDPEYQELYDLRKKYNLPIVRIQLKWENPGIKVLGFKDNMLELRLPAHSFALVELK